MKRGKMPFNFHSNLSDVLGNLFRYRIGYVALVAEVEVRSDRSLNSQDSASPPVIDPTDVTSRRLERQATLRLRLGLDKIAESFRLDEVELSIEKRTPRKLSGLCRSDTPNRAKPTQQGIHDGAPAMNVEFTAVFAGKTCRPGEESDKPSIDRRTIRGAKSSQHKARRRWNGSGYRFDNESNARA
jgi:hypothetical protein